MDNRIITIAYAILRESAPYGAKILSIPTGSICELIEIVPNVLYSGEKTIWAKVRYRDNVGYAYFGFFDKYQNSLEQDVVDLSGLQTSDKYDAKQYIEIDGRKKVNQCGEISSGYILGISLAELLNSWETKDSNLVSRIWKGSVDRGTSAQTLVDLLKNFDNNAFRLNDYFMDEVLDRSIFTPTRVRTALNDNKRIILGVKIGRDGYIGTGSINHWVVIDDIDIRGKQAIVKVFNPYMNRFEVYSWSEIMKNNAGIDGVVADFWDAEQEAGEVIEEPVSVVEPLEELSDSEMLSVLWQDYLDRVG